MNAKEDAVTKQLEAEGKLTVKEPSHWIPFTIQNVLRLKTQLTQAQARIQELEGLVIKTLNALKAADGLLVRCHKWTKTESSVMVPVQKLRMDIEEWAREYGKLDEEIMEKKL